MFGEELRSNCNHLVTLVATELAKGELNDIESLIRKTNIDKQKIWVLIDKYIEEEDKLINKIIEK